MHRRTLAKAAWAMGAALAGALLLVGAGCTTKIDPIGLLTAGRDGWQQPTRVIAALDIAPGQRVAEIGAGNGYWLDHLSRAVGPEGMVYAVEVEAENVEALHARIAEHELANVEVIHGRYDDPLLPDGQIDLAITCLTYHHIEDRVAYFEALRSDLAPGGRVAHLDDRADLGIPLRWLPTAGHTQDIAVMDDEMRRAGYAFDGSFDFLLLQAFHIYAPNDEASSDYADRRRAAAEN